MKTLLCLTSLVILLALQPASAADHAAEVKRAIITTSIDSREPTDNLNNSTLDTSYTKVYFFSEVINQADKFVTHRWFKDGKLEAEVVLKIGSNRWRTYSSKNLDPNFHEGNWQVEVVDHQGKRLASENFTYNP